MPEHDDTERDDLAAWLTSHAPAIIPGQGHLFPLPPRASTFDGGPVEQADAHAQLTLG